MCFVRRLGENFGYGYCVAVVSTYGLNQGLAAVWKDFGTQFYFVDVLGVSPGRFSEYLGFAHVPWDAKALWGMASDIWPICGYHLAPYVVLAGSVGLVAYGALALSTPAATVAAFLCLLGNLSHALPDVMIDASVAVRCKTHPALATDLQALCWGSYGLCGIIAAPIQGWVIDSMGPEGSQVGDPPYNIIGPHVVRYACRRPSQ